MKTYSFAHPDGPVRKTPAFARSLTLAFCSAALTACGGGGGDNVSGSSDHGDTAGAGLYYSYPADGQAGVAPNTPLVLGFLDETDATAADFTLTGPETGRLP